MSLDEIAREERREVARCYREMQEARDDAVKNRRLALECEAQGFMEIARGFMKNAAKFDLAAARWEKNAKRWEAIADVSTFLAAHEKSPLDSKIAFLALKMKRGECPRQNAAAN